MISTSPLTTHLTLLKTLALIFSTHYKPVGLSTLANELIQTLIARRAKACRKARATSCLQGSSITIFFALLTHLARKLQHPKQAKAQTNQTTEDISCFLRQQVFSTQQNHASAAAKNLWGLRLPNKKLKQCAGNTLPWDWSLQSGPAGNPGILGPPPSGHWCRAAWPRRLQQFSSRRGPHPWGTCAEARTGTLWFYPRGCSPWCARPGHGSEGWDPHSPA